MLRRRAGQTHTGCGDADPSGPKCGERDLQPIPLLAEAVRLRHQRPLEDQLRGDRVADAHLAFVARDPEPWRLPLDDEGGDRVAATRAIDGGEDDGDLRLLAVGDPDLAARERVAPIGPFGEQRQGRRVRAGAGLRQGEGAQVPAGHHRRKEAQLLLVAPERQDRQLGEDVDRQADRHPHVGRGDLLAGQDPGEGAHPRSAVFLRIGQAGEAQRGHPLEERPVVALLLVTLRDRRGELALGELAHRVADMALLRREGEGVRPVGGDGRAHRPSRLPFSS